MKKVEEKTRCTISPESVTEQVRQLLLEQLNREVPGDDVDLIASGLLDSLALAELLLALEETFEIALDYETLEIDSLRTLKSIGQLVTASQVHGS